MPFSTRALYGNAFGFAGRPLTRNFDDPLVDAVVMGVPFDLGTTGRSGARLGPQAIRQASTHLRWEGRRWPWTFDAFERLNAIDYGDVEYAACDTSAMLSAVQNTAGAIFAAGKRLLSFGGDHLVALPLLRAAHSQHGQLALVHFDAHTDTEQEDGGVINHGSMFHHAQREGLIDPAHSVQIGIRTEYDYESHPFTVMDAAHVNDASAEAVIQNILHIVGERPVYLSFDIDCLDPAFAPGTGTPVVGGLTTDKAMKILRGLKELNLVAMDVVEVAPAYDSADITALAAATLGLEYLYILASKRAG